MHRYLLTDTEVNKNLSSYLETKEKLPVLLLVIDCKQWGLELCIYVCNFSLLGKIGMKFLSRQFRQNQIFKAYLST